MIENLSKVEYASLLYDFYGELLDENKKEIMNLYHEDNLSLAEIAEDLGQSRQGVHYTLKKAEKSWRNMKNGWDWFESIWRTCESTSKWSRLRRSTGRTIPWMKGFGRISGCSPT